MMKGRTTAIWVLGAVQCVYWGILYYGFSVLLVPMRLEFGASAASIAGAFSLGLAVSAALASGVGRHLDRGAGQLLLRGGGLSVPLLLWAWSAVDSVTGLYLVWLGLGACMALVLYETAFALVTRAISDAGLRLRALASVTVVGGLASTLFLPLIAYAASHLGWRASLWVLAWIWLLASFALERWALPALRDPGLSDGPQRSAPETAIAIERRLLWRLGTPFVLATFAAMTLTTSLIPSLLDRGLSLTAASWVLAAFGLMQLPGRLWLWRGGTAALSVAGLLVWPLLLQALGLSLLALVSGRLAAVLGVALFGMGAGLHTLARPWIVPQLVGVANAGQVNGQIARAQGIARAIGPFAAASLYGWLGGSLLFGAIALLLLAASPLARRTARQSSATQTLAQGS